MKLIVYSNNAKACYDRVVHSIAMLLMIKCGSTYNNTKLFFQALKEGNIKLARTLEFQIGNINRRINEFFTGKWTQFNTHK